MAAIDPQTEFPIPADLQGFWTWDKMHMPRPITPLTEEIFLAGVQDGFSKAMDEFACPVKFLQRAVNYYGYGAIAPLDLGEETIESRIGRYQATMGRVLPNIGDLANVPLGIVALLLVLQLRSDEGAGRSTFSIDTPSVLALAGVFTGATLIGTAIQHPSPIVIAAAACLLPVSAVAYVVSYVRRGSGVVKFQLFTRRNYWVSAAGVSLSNLVQYTILIAMPLYLTSQRSLGSARVGLMLFPMSGATVGISPLAGRLADRIGSKPVMMGGATFLVAGAATLAGALGHLPLLALAAMLSVGGFGVGVQQVAQQSAALKAWPPYMAGAAAGTLSMMRYVGSVVGAAVVATLLGVNPNETAFRVLLLVVAGFGVANFIVTTVLRQGEPRGAEPAGVKLNAQSTTAADA
jgi:Major Facilitator Superfamily